MPPEVIKQLLSYGVLGVAVVVEGYVIWRLYQRAEQLADKRLKDALERERAYQHALEENTKTVSGLGRRLLELEQERDRTYLLLGRRRDDGD